MKVVTPPFVGSYVHLDKAVAIGNSDPKFSIQIVLPKDDPFWKKIHKIEQQVAKESPKFGGKVPKALQTTVNDGDLTDREEVQGMNYMTVSCDESRRPQVLDVNKEPIIEAGALYSGAIYVVSLRPYAWEYAGKKGVSFGLNHAMKVADGTPLDGRSSAESDFDDLDLSEFLDDSDDEGLL